MTLTKMKLLLLIIAVTLGISFSILLMNSGEKAQMPLSTAAPQVLLHCNFYNEKDFLSSVAQAKSYKLDSKKILGGVTPHHLLAGNLIASFFNTVSKSNPEIVVIVAPNHKGIGVKTIQTGSWNWDTPFGILKCDLEDANLLVGPNNAEMNAEVLQQDHSIAGLIPYVKYYMPNAKVLPVLVHGNLGVESAKELGINLVKMLAGKRFVVIASVDFSHYLTMKQADIKDTETLKTIKSGNLQRLAMYGNDNLDSPPSIITLMSAMAAEKTKGFKVLAHSNAARIAKLKTDNTTSYFTMVWV